MLKRLYRDFIVRDNAPNVLPVRHGREEVVLDRLGILSKGHSQSICHAVVEFSSEKNLPYLLAFFGPHSMLIEASYHPR